MKERELRAAAICGVCRQKFGSSGLPVFYRITIARYGVDRGPLMRQTALEMMMGGHVDLAQALSPDEDMTVTLQEPATITVCETCAAERTNVHRLAGLIEVTSAEKPQPSDGGG